MLTELIVAITVEDDKVKRSSEYVAEVLIDMAEKINKDGIPPVDRVNETIILKDEDNNVEATGFHKRRS